MAVYGAWHERGSSKVHALPSSVVSRHLCPAGRALFASEAGPRLYVRSIAKFRGV